MGIFKKQLRIVLRNCGFINPENIDEYIARDGYQALGKVLTEMTPEEVIKRLRIQDRGDVEEPVSQQVLNGKLPVKTNLMRNMWYAMLMKATRGLLWTVQSLKVILIRFSKQWQYAVTASVLPKG